MCKNFSVMPIFQQHRFTPISHATTSARSTRKHILAPAKTGLATARHSRLSFQTAVVIGLIFVSGLVAACTGDPKSPAAQQAPLVAGTTVQTANQAAPAASPVVQPQRDLIDL